MATPIFWLYEEGYKAAQSGKGWGWCPYNQHSDEWVHWMDGWNSYFN